MKEVKEQDGLVCVVKRIRPPSKNMRSDDIRHRLHRDFSESGMDRERWRVLIGAAKSRLEHNWPWD